MKNSFLILLSICLIIGCKKNDPEPKITLNFTHTVDEIPLVIGTGCGDGGECLPGHPCCNGEECLPYTNSAGQQYNVQTLNYIISDIKLHNTDGGSVLVKDIHFIDASDISTLSLDIEIDFTDDITYHSISFTMGLENSMNINNEYLNEDWHSTMVWPEMMGGGYHYMKLEGAYETESTFYNTHTGGLETVDNPERTDHSFSCTGPTNDPLFIIQTPLNSIAVITINMEINNWFQNPNTFTLTNDGIMGDATKQAILQANGQEDVFSIDWPANMP